LLFPLVVELIPEGEEGSVDPVSGMSAEVILDIPSAATLTVPLAAVVNPGGSSPSVFRLRGDRMEQVEVEVMTLVGERVAVQGELAAGDEVVVSGHASLLDGQQVEVVR
jgi:multidrug efflux pump subunit AcrA (membrane-fusion protein)